jgi:asparagine synthase (glutamine-hydrolysing)
MCGIFGLVGKNYSNVSDIFIRDLHHRGPDNSDYILYDNKNLLLGQNRLAIIDLSISANQPMVSNCEKYTIVFNGEIYNYKEIQTELKGKGYIFNTNSDTEVVLNSYIEWGKHCLNRFRGMFAFCVYSQSENLLFLARDRFGCYRKINMLVFWKLTMHEKWKITMHDFESNLLSKLVLKNCFSVLHSVAFA